MRVPVSISPRPGESRTAYAGPASPPRVEAPALARWLGVSGKTVYELTKAGIAVRTGGELYRLKESVRRYCEHIRRMAQQGGIAS